MIRRNLLMAVLATLLVSCGSNTPALDEFKGNTVEVSFDANNAKKETINPFIYGTFIEHIEKCIYNGLWSETILDRKFYKPVGQDVSQWMVSEGEVGNDNISPFEGENSPLLHKDSSIKQIGISLDNKKYNGYVYAKGQGTLEITLSAGNSTFKTSIKVNSDNYEKYNFDIDITHKSTKYTLIIKSLESSITIDSVSLMPFDNVNGMRKDTLDVLKELNSPFYRWPGGNFVSGYDFYDGIGDRDKRSTKRNLNYCGQISDFDNDAERLANDLMKIGSLGFYGAFEPNDFGLDEFIAMCKYLNAEPNIVLNSGLGQEQMAKDQVEYCNGISGKYASLRPQKEPYRVKYFSIGNEMNGDWQLGHMSINQYIKKHNAFAKAIKSIDPNIKIIAVGDNHTDWSSRMVDGCKGNINLISEHFYAERHEFDTKDHILSLKKQTEYRIRNHRNISGAKNITMAIDEYAYLNAETTSRLKDGMGVASALNVMLQNSDVVEVACYSSTINATQGNVETDDFNSFLEGSGYALSLYRKNMKKHYLPIKYSYKSADDYYEIAGTISDDKKEIALSVINTSNEEIKITSSQFKNIKDVDYVTGEYLESVNNSKTNELKRKYKKINNKDIVIEPRSISLINIEI